MIKEIENNNFNELIKDGLVLVDFYATWCGPCKMMAPILEKVSKTVNVVKVNVDTNSALASSYQINSIPTLVLFHNGNKISKKVGYTDEKELMEWIKSI